jgi:TonB family protein
MPFRKLLFWSVVGHLVVLILVLILGFIRIPLRPSKEILHLQNVRLIEKAAPEPQIAAPEPEPVVEPPPPPPPPPERPEPEPIPEPPPRVEIPPPPERPARVIAQEPDPAEELQRQENERRRREREEEEERQREREEQRRREEEEQQRRLQQQARERAQQRAASEDESVEVEGENLGNFDNLLVNYLSRHWHGQRRWATTDLQVRIALRILRDGTFSDVRMLSSSGDLEFDAAALEAVRDSSPGPRLPAFIREPHLDRIVRMTAR